MLFLKKDLIHRMQIWRTTRSAHGTSQMEARLVRLWCFVLTMLFQKSLVLLSIWSFSFVLPTRFCVPECHCKRVESFTAAKVFFFSVSPFASEEKARSPAAIVNFFSSSQRIALIRYFPLEVNGGRFLSLLVAFRNTATRRHSEIKRNRSTTK